MRRASSWSRRTGCSETAVTGTGCGGSGRSGPAGGRPGTRPATNGWAIEPSARANASSRWSTIGPRGSCARASREAPGRPAKPEHPGLLRVRGGVPDVRGRRVGEGRADLQHHVLVRAEHDLAGVPGVWLAVDPDLELVRTTDREGRHLLRAELLAPDPEEVPQRELPRRLGLGSLDVDDAARVVRVQPVGAGAEDPDLGRHVHGLAVVQDLEMRVVVRRQLLAGVAADAR